MTELTRRDFLEVSALSGAGLLLGFRLIPTIPAGATSPPVATELNAWVRIGGDDGVTLIVSEVEMGQGVLTALPMILAEELEVDWRQVRSEHAPADAARYGQQSTGGSTSVRANYDRLRRVGAAAREMLVQAAAQRWNVAPSSCRAERGTVVHDASGRRLGYGALAPLAAQLEPPEQPALKDPKQFRIIGQALPRLDTEPKVRATATYGIDVQFPGLLTARVAHPPAFGGSLKRFDASAALAVPGVRKVVEIPTGIAVAADHYWAASKGLEALEVEWHPGPNAGLSSAAILEHCQAATSRGRSVRNEGDATAPLARAAEDGTRVDASYRVPFLAHATMEPMNCTARVTEESCELWVPTQSPTGAQRAAAEISGLSVDRVTVHTAFLGGGFGRRSATDFVADAVHTAKAVGAPVKVVYSREDDMRAGAYRPVSTHVFAGALDDQGWPLAWRHQIACPSILARLGWLQGDVDGTSVEGAANLPYAIPHLDVRYAEADVPVPPHFWRSVGSSQNAYVTECFLDELARAGGKDPVAVRRRLLGNHPRHLRVLDAAAEKAGWGTALPDGHARGVAVHECFGSVVAEVAEVSLREDRSVRVHRVVCAVDCGSVVNPSIVRAQMESGIVFGLSAALYGQIRIERGRAVEGNFDSYPVLRMREMPVIETEIVVSGDPLGGIGEPATPPIAPAVCNALLALTGRPVRALPIRTVHQT